MGCGKTALFKRITTKQTGQLWEHLPMQFLGEQSNHGGSTRESGPGTLHTPAEMNTQTNPQI